MDLWVKFLNRALNTISILLQVGLDLPLVSRDEGMAKWNTTEEGLSIGTIQGSIPKRATSSPRSNP